MLSRFFPLFVSLIPRASLLQCAAAAAVVGHPLSAGIQETCDRDPCTSADVEPGAQCNPQTEDCSGKTRPSRNLMTLASDSAWCFMTLFLFQLAIF